MALAAFASVSYEFMSVSLLTPISGELRIGEGKAADAGNRRRDGNAMATRGRGEHRDDPVRAIIWRDTHTFPDGSGSGSEAPRRGDHRHAHHRLQPGHLWRRSVGRRAAGVRRHIAC
jgi:hypothetical protein